MSDPTAEGPARAARRAPSAFWPDALLLARLQARHLKTKLAFWAAVAGVETGDASVGNRLYGVYLGILLAVWLWFTWSEAFGMAFVFGQSLAPLARESLRRPLAWLPAVTLVALSADALRSSPVKFASADMACVAGTSVSRPAVAAVWSAAGTLRAALVGAALANLACAVLAEAATSPLAFRASASAAAFGAVIAAGAYAWSRAVGLARVSVGLPQTRLLRLAATGGAAAVFGLLPLIGGLASLLALLQGAPRPQALAALLAAVVGIVAVPLAARRLDTARVVEGSGLSAQLSRFAPLRMYDAAMFADIRRRARLARRPPHGRMAEATGPLAVTARAWTSHKRQRSTLLTPLLWGGMIIPAGVQLAATAGYLTMLFPWLFVVLATPARALVHGFRDDLDHPGLRTLLPYDGFTLLLMSALPAAAIMFASSGAVLALLARGGSLTAGWIVLTLALDVAIVTCAALEVIPVGTSGRTIGFGISAPVAGALVLLSARFASPWLGALVALGLAGLIALVLRTARD